MVLITEKKMYGLEPYSGLNFQIADNYVRYIYFGNTTLASDEWSKREKL